MSYLPSDPQLRRYFWIFLVIGIVMRLILVVIVPMYPDYMANPTEYLAPGYNDEPLHLQYVRYISEEWDWPIWTADRDSTNFRTGEYLQPPVYYFLAAPLFKLGHSIRTDWELHSTRLLSVIFGIIASFFVFFMARLWINNEKIAVGAFAAMQFSPNTLIFTSLVSNDSMIMATAAIIYFFFIRYHLTQQPESRCRWVLGSALGASVWVKLSGLTLMPLLLFMGRRNDSQIGQWKARILTGLIAVLIALPVPAWNLYHYGSLSPNMWSQIVPESWPEPLLLGVEKPAIERPYETIKTCVRLAAMPYEKLWGSSLEKVTSLAWALLWGTILVTGGYLILRQNKLAWIFYYGLFWSIAGFIVYNIEVFQVEFRLFGPAFPGLALMSAIGADYLKIPLPLQALLWCIPVLFIPLYVGYAPF